MEEMREQEPPRWRQELEFHMELEEVRATIRHNMKARGWSWERAAKEIGTTAHRLRELMDGRAYILTDELEPFIRWCTGKEMEQVFPEQAALSLLCQVFRPRTRSTVRERLARRLQRVYLMQRLSAPMWIYIELRNWMFVRPRSYLGRRRG